MPNQRGSEPRPFPLPSVPDQERWLLLLGARALVLPRPVSRWAGRVGMGRGSSEFEGRRKRASTQGRLKLVEINTLIKKDQSEPFREQEMGERSR